MSVAGLALDASTRSPIILLRDRTGRRQVPIWIDHAQAHNIVAGLQQSEVESPLTHDLIIAILHAGNLHLDRVIIHEIEGCNFQAILKLNIKETSNHTSEKIPPRTWGMES